MLVAAAILKYIVGTALGTAVNPGDSSKPGGQQANLGYLRQYTHAFPWTAAAAGHRHAVAGAATAAAPCQLVASTAVASITGASTAAAADDDVPLVVATAGPFV